MYAIERFESRCKKAIESILKRSVELEVPPPEIGALFALPCHGLSKYPEELAGELASKLESLDIDLVGKIEARGAYVNFFPSGEFYEIVLREILQKGDDYGSGEKKDEVIVIDFSSPNVAKPMSVGHLRSTIIGQSLYNILTFLGYKCIGDNHLGDWGTQFGALLAAFELWGNEEELESDPIRHLFELYVKFHRESEKNERLEELAREKFRLLESGSEREKELWKRFVDLSLREFQRIYDLLGVKFDYVLGESFYYSRAKRLVQRALEQGIAKISKGVVVIPLEEFGLPPLVIQKSDETTLYSTRDLATIEYRLEEFSPSKMIYVVGAEQKLYFKQLFAAARKLGFNCDFVHVDFGLVTIGGEKMSTRRGKVVLLEDLLREAIAKAKQVIEERNPLLQNSDEIAKIVGIGAVIFNDLKGDRIQQVDFDLNRMLNFEGDSCPYVQYAYVRGRSILRTAGVTKVTLKSVELLSDYEKKLIELLSFFPRIVKLAAETLKPHYIAQYLLDLAESFNSFYTHCRVIGSPNEATRLAIVSATTHVLKSGLSLLNIRAPEMM